MSITMIGQKVLINGVLCLTNVSGFCGSSLDAVWLCLWKRQRRYGCGGRRHVIVDVCVQVYT